VYVGADVIKECPGVGKVAGVDVVTLLVTWLAEDWPRNTGLKLEVVERDGESAAHGVLFAEVRDNELSVHDALFGSEVIYLHATKVGGAMSDSFGSSSVDSHLGKECG
jgi:hypothetical protein